MPEKVSFAAFFGPNRNDMTNRANWGLKEYRKYDPQALSDDPELYARLREKEYGEEQEPYHNLAYYRKHNPEYLDNIPTNTSGCLPANVKTSNEQSITNTIFMALNREVWIDQVKEGFYPDDSFLQKATDYSQFVDHNRLHIASAGIDPKVLVNNTTYPISVIGA